MIKQLTSLALAAILPATVLQAQAPPPPQAQAPAQQLPAQNPPAPQVPQQQNSDVPSDVNATTLKGLGADEVSLVFTVTDKKGHYIPDLQLGEFALLDNQRAPAAVRSFHQQINLPLRVGIVIDASTSIRSRFQFEQQAASEFLLQILKARADRAFVMGFDVTSNVTADWTNNQDALEQGINRLRPGGGTALYDAVYTACRTKLYTERGVEPVRKAMILISDGDDNQSRVYLSEAIKECQRAETIIYSISTNWTPSRGPGDKVMQQLAEETGGEVFFPPSVEDISKSFTDIETELRSQYALNYSPADFKHDGSFRKIYLYCKHTNYTVRTRSGYFAPKD